eukprot:4385476-Amphidinium_carterae.2
MAQSVDDRTGLVPPRKTRRHLQTGGNGVGMDKKPKVSLNLMFQGVASIRSARQHGKNLGDGERAGRVKGGMGQHIGRRRGPGDACAHELPNGRVMICEYDTR